MEKSNAYEFATKDQRTNIGFFTDFDVEMHKVCKMWEIGGLLMAGIGLLVKHIIDCKHKEVDLFYEEVEKQGTLIDPLYRSVLANSEIYHKNN